MGARDDGGPAFPVLQDGWTRTDASGLSMRDYFAAKAMVPILQNARDDRQVALCATAAYAMADAMLKARAA